MEMCSDRRQAAGGGRALVWVSILLPHRAERPSQTGSRRHRRAHVSVRTRRPRGDFIVMCFVENEVWSKWIFVLFLLVHFLALILGFGVHVCRRCHCYFFALWQRETTNLIKWLCKLTRRCFLYERLPWSHWTDCLKDWMWIKKSVSHILSEEEDSCSFVCRFIHASVHSALSLTGDAGSNTQPPRGNTPIIYWFYWDFKLRL